METQMNMDHHLPRLVGGIAAILASASVLILLSGMATGSLTTPVKSYAGAPAPIEPSVQAAAPGARTYRCAECGVIASTREIEAAEDRAGVYASGRMLSGHRGELEGKPVRSYEITVRLQDGSMRVITDANSANWRQGERVIIIAGVGQ